MSQSQAEIIALIKNLNAGDVAEVQFSVNGATKTRKVTVESKHSSEYSEGAFTYSGNVRPGSIAGGNVYIMAGEPYFQATMQQQTRRIVGLKVHKLLALRAA